MALVREAPYRLGRCWREDVLVLHVDRVVILVPLVDIAVGVNSRRDTDAVATIIS
jgi:hypothetical protein